MTRLRGVLAAFSTSWLTRDILVPFLVTRAMLVVVSLLALHAFQGIAPGPNNWEVKPKGNIGPIRAGLSPGSHPLLNTWIRWDAGWYESLAKEGYKFVAGQQSNTAFFPAYPATIRAVHGLVRGRTDWSWFVSGLIASNLALLGALFYLVRLVRLDADHETAARSALYLLAFPTTFFLSSVYTESLFILVTVAAFYHARRGQWLGAGLFGGLAALTRSPGILLCAPLAVEYLAQREFQWRKIRADVLWLGLIPAALGALMLYFHLRFGNMNAVRDAQASWGAGWGAFRGPWFPFFEMARRPLAGHDWVDLGFTLLGLAMAVYVALRLRLSYGVYAVVAILFLTSWGQLESMPRYVLIIFPMFVAFARWGGNELFHRAYLMAGSGLAALFMIEFALWRWVA
ncbi:MAG TPA: mannosyltransferase family protein [Chthoniobacterales bacterium]